MRIEPPKFPPDASTEVAFRASLARERARWIATAALVRTVGSAIFLSAVATLWLVTARRDWLVYLIPLVLHAVASLFAWAMRRHRLHRTVAVVMAVADVALVFAVQQLSMPFSPFPSGVAGFSLGLFCMVIVLDAEILPRTGVFVLATEAFVFQATLMYVAGVSTGPIVIAGLVLGLVAWTARTASGRMEALVREQVEAQLARARETARARELEEARSTIEHLLHAERTQNERLVSLQREKDQFTHLLVHDLRSPLTALIGYIDLIRERLARGELASLQTADEAMRVAERLTAMIHAILDVAKLEEGRLVLRREPVSVADLMHDVTTVATPVARKQAIHLVLEFDPVLTLDADRELMRRVLENLVSNALRYTPRHGRMRVAAQRDGSHAVVRVQNEGVAIEPARRASLFQKFGQLEGATVGWGLGLYFCRLAIEAHQGSIRIEDAPGWRVTFAVRVPLVQPEGASQPTPAGAARA